jgi:hypothetical protein
MTLSRYVCPACARAVFNRRLANCEFCDTPLPASFGYKPAELALIAAQEAQSDRARRALAREAAALEEARQRRRQP